MKPLISFNLLHLFGENDRRERSGTLTIFDFGNFFQTQQTDKHTFM